MVVWPLVLRHANMVASGGIQFVPNVSRAASCSLLGV